MAGQPVIDTEIPFWKAFRIVAAQPEELPFNIDLFRWVLNEFQVVWLEVESADEFVGRGVELRANYRNALSKLAVERARSSRPAPEETIDDWGREWHPSRAEVQVAEAYPNVAWIALMPPWFRRWLEDTVGMSYLSAQYDIGETAWRMLGMNRAGSMHGSSGQSSKDMPTSTNG